MTPLQIQILLHYATDTGDFIPWNDEVIKTCNELHLAGMLLKNEAGTEYPVYVGNMEALKPYAEAVANVKLPVQKWVVEGPVTEPTMLEQVNELIGRLDGDEKELVSDGFHTFKELYEFRKVYNAALFNLWFETNRYQVVKSYRHSDGELCFGGGWFIVTATLPTGQVSNHYENKDWDLFRCTEVTLPPVWDGHTAADVLERIKALREFKRTLQDDYPKEILKSHSDSITEQQPGINSPEIQK